MMRALVMTRSWAARLTTLVRLHEKTSKTKPSTLFMVQTLPFSVDELSRHNTSTDGPAASITRVRFIRAKGVLSGGAAKRTCMAGYSGKPLAKKLGITEHTRIFVCDAPLDYAHLLGPLARGPLIVKSIDERTDLVHVFAKEKKRLADRLSEVLPKLRPNAAIWVS